MRRVPGSFVRSFGFSLLALIAAPAWSAPPAKGSGQQPQGHQQQQGQPQAHPQQGQQHPPQQGQPQQVRQQQQGQQQVHPQQGQHPQQQQGQPQQFRQQGQQQQPQQVRPQQGQQHPQQQPGQPQQIRQQGQPQQGQPGRIVGPTRVNNPHPGHPGTIIQENDRSRNDRYDVPLRSWAPHDVAVLPSRKAIPFQKGFDLGFQVIPIDPPNMRINTVPHFQTGPARKGNFVALAAKHPNSPYGVKAAELLKSNRLKIKQKYVKYVKQWDKYKGFFKGPYAVWYKYYWNLYFPFGFLGGFWFPTWPSWNIDFYSYYPMVYWFNDEGGASEIYQDWNGATSTCDGLLFLFPGAPFPTEAWRDLGIEMSALTPDLQCNFRTDMNTVVQSLSDQISNLIGTPFTIGNGELVINSYTNYLNQVVTVDGYVVQDESGVQRAFNASLDLINPQNTTAFMPVSPNPTSEDVQSLDQVNQVVVNQGQGDPLQTVQDPMPPDKLLTPPADLVPTPVPPTI